MTRVGGRSPIVRNYKELKQQEGAEVERRREIPWALLIFNATIFLLLEPHRVVDLVLSSSGDVLEAITAIVSILGVGSLICALVISDLACMADWKNRRSFSQTRRLLEVAMRNTGIGALWGSLVGVVLGMQDYRLTLLNLVSGWGTLGALIGAVTCLPRCEALIVSSIEEVWHRRSLKYLVGVFLVFAMTGVGLYGYILPLAGGVWQFLDK